MLHSAVNSALPGLLSFPLLMFCCQQLGLFWLSVPADYAERSAHFAAAIRALVIPEAKVSQWTDFLESTGHKYTLLILC